MIAFIIQRLSWAIPTLLFIILIGFGLSVHTPGDPVLSRLKSMEGQSSDPNGLVNFDSQYIRLRHQMGLDKPVFYFSIVPIHYPDTLYRIHFQDQRDACSALLKTGIEWRTIDQYRIKVQTLKQTISSPAIQLSLTLKNETRAMLNNMLTSHSIDNIQTLWNTFKHSAAPSTKPLLNAPIAEIDNTIKDLQNEQNEWRNLVPKLSWHGFNNQYHQWLKGIIKLDFGQSYQDGKEVIDHIVPSLKWTFWLNGSALFLTVCLGIPLGVWLASQYGSRIDQLVTAALFSSYALPSYWIATLMIIFFCSGSFFSLFPVGGVESLAHDSTWPFVKRLIDWLHHLALPVVALTYFNLSLIALQVRNDTKAALDALHIRTAYAKGLSSSTILWKHAFRNSLLPIISLVGQLIPTMVSGSIFIESIFAIPGSGSLLYQAVLSRDYPVIIGVFTCVGTLTILSLLLVEMLHYWFNPLLRENTNATL